jgi:hypothetical protein
MTTSQRKIVSNQINARRSTGPKTASGKRRASKNSLQHGLSLPAFLFPPTKSLFDEIYVSLKAELDVVAMSNTEQGNHEPHSRLSFPEFTGARDPRSDQVAHFANNFLDLNRLRSARKEAVIRLMNHPEDPKALSALSRLLRYGKRLNSKSKYTPKEY